ncbi:hypothetical protein V8B97DRAFT_1916841 [Scleroderma yunnanense]
MDVDWCLSCERRIDGFSPTTGPYCSRECLSYAQPSSSSRLLAAQQHTPDTYRIRQWAKAIPPHVPAGAPAHPFADRSSASVSPSNPRPPLSLFRRQHTPKLIERTAVSTPLATLCVSSPAQVRPSHPSRTSSRTFSQAKTDTTGTVSEASTSLSSLLSEPMVVTPDEDCSFGAGISALVRSWIHRDRERSVVAREEYLEKPQDYFSSPRAKRPSSPSFFDRSKKTPSPRSPLVPDRKPSVRRRTRTHERGSTPTETHTPTPVVFPSSRAVDLDWDGDEESPEIIFAPRAQYHPAFQTKSELPYEEDVHWTRSPSPAPSASTTGSSILLMAPKRWDSSRGRLQTSIA